MTLVNIPFLANGPYKNRRQPGFVTWTIVFDSCFCLRSQAKVLGGEGGGGENILGEEEAGKAFASDLEHHMEIGATEIGEGHNRPREQCEQRHGDREVAAKVQHVLHIHGLIVICQPWVTGCWLSSPEERVGLVEDAERQ